MKEIQAPEYYIDSSKVSVFLAGGITDCPNWQSTVIEELKDTDLLIYNPRRDNFPREDPSEARNQVQWEYIHLTKIVDIISFWFSKGSSPQPIALYELGRYATILADNGKKDRLVVGVDPDYSRREDVLYQLEFMGYDVSSLTSNDLNTHIKNIKERAEDIKWKKIS
jgi:hypothetical protein